LADHAHQIADPVPMDLPDTVVLEEPCCL
jgi:hypothetical protein